MVSHAYIFITDRELNNIGLALNKFRIYDIHIRVVLNYYLFLWINSMISTTLYVLLCNITIPEVVQNVFLKFYRESDHR